LFFDRSAFAEDLTYLAIISTVPPAF
jgi:hypothetical protein